MRNIYSYPSTKAFLLKTYQNDTKYSILGQMSAIPSSIDLNNYLIDGSKNITIDGSNFLVTTRTMIDTNNDVYNETFFFGSLTTP